MAKCDKSRCQVKPPLLMSNPNIYKQNIYFKYTSMPDILYTSVQNWRPKNWVWPYWCQWKHRNLYPTISCGQIVYTLNSSVPEEYLAEPE